MSNSSSGIIPPQSIHVSAAFTELTELPTLGFNRLIRAKRYGRWFMLKGLKPEYATQLIYRELLQKEFDILTSLEHTSIVQTYGWEDIPQVGECIVMEYVDGITLQDLLKEKPSRQLRRKIADELISALCYVHAKQIAHRDLKPANILITNNGHNVKLIDFGLSDTDSHEILKQPAGTDRYSSPEQKLLPICDCRNDVYSVGKILLELHIGFAYNRVGRHCLLPRERRYQNMVEAAEAIHRIRRTKHIMQTLSLVILFVCLIGMTVTLYVQLQNAKRTTLTLTKIINRPDTVLRYAASSPRSDTLSHEDAELLKTTKLMDKIITAGYRTIDKAIKPYQHYCDTVSCTRDNNDVTIPTLHRMQKVIDDYCNAHKASLSSSQQANLSNALNLYIAGIYGKCNERLLKLPLNPPGK